MSSNIGVNYYWGPLGPPIVDPPLFAWCFGMFIIMLAKNNSSVDINLSNVNIPTVRLIIKHEVPWRYEYSQSLRIRNSGVFKMHQNAF